MKNKKIFQLFNSVNIFAEDLTMKKFILSASFIAASFTSVMAQSALHPWGVSADFNFKELDTDYGRNLLQFRYPNFQLGAGVTRYINNWVDAGLNLNYGNFFQDSKPWVPSSQLQNLNYKGLNASLTGRFKFNNGKWLKEESFLAPYVTAGFAFFTGKMQQPVFNFDGEAQAWEKVNNFTIPLGIGLRVNCTKRLALNLNSTWMIGFNDKFDMNEGGKPNDKFFEHRIGLVYQFGKGSEKTEEGSSTDAAAPAPAPAK